MEPGALLACAGARWQPGIGDPSVAGWATVAAYLLAAALAGRVAGRLPVPRGRAARGAWAAERLFWLGAGALLAFLAVNKQLDLQSAMTAVGRCAAQAGGWYDGRRAVQVAVIGGLVLGAGLAGLALLVLLRRTLARTGLALLGLVAVVGFVLVRAVGFHDVDRLIGLPRTGGLRLNWVFELGAIGLFAAGALRALLRARRPGP